MPFASTVSAPFLALLIATPTPLSYLGPKFLSGKLVQETGEVSAHRAFNAPQDACGRLANSSRSIFRNFISRKRWRFFDARSRRQLSITFVESFKASDEIHRAAREGVRDGGEIRWWRIYAIYLLSFSLPLSLRLADNRSREAR